MRFRGIFIWVLWAAVTASAGADPIVLNPGFEYPEVDGFAYWPSGCDWSWEAPACGMAIAESGSAWGNTAYKGNQNLVLQQIVSCWQDISGFVVGRSYTVSWAEASRASPVGSNDFRVWLDGTIISGLHTVSNVNWQVKSSITFQATSSTHTLKFEALNSLGGDRTVFIDAISIDAVAAAHWKLDEGTGSAAGDSSGNGNNGTLYNMQNDDWTVGIHGTGLEFDGGNDYVRVPDAASLNFGDGSFSIALWVKCQTSGPGMMIIKGTSGGGYSGKRYSLGVQGYDVALVVDDNVTQTELWSGNGASAGGVLEDGGWHHVAAIRDRTADKLKIYIDGEPESEGTDDTNLSIDAPGEYLYIGRGGMDDDSQYLKGMLDDIRLYNYAISESEIEDLAERTHLYASDPRPHDGETHDPDEELLSWTPGEGAYSHDLYFGSSEAAVASAQRLAGDINGNGGVDLPDMLEFAGQWLGHPQEPYADLTGDSFVDLADFSVMASEWTEQAPEVFKVNQTSTSYSTGTLVEGADYYWRVDEVNGTNTYKGEVWHFVTEQLPLNVISYPGWVIYSPSSSWGYRYGPSIIINEDDSVDVWFASEGSGDEVDWIRHRKSYDGGVTWGSETVALRPTPGSVDAWSVCDPGVINFGGYYYIGYTSTTESTTGTDNDVFVARSTSPTGGFEKWNGSGWGGNPQPFIVFTGTAGAWGAGEPSFVLKDNTIYIYYTWRDGTNQTRIRTASALNPNWPGDTTYQGVAAELSYSEDSLDVKYIDHKQKFVAVSVRDRWTDNSSISIRISTDGLTFTLVDSLTDYIQTKAHNSGISGTPEGHIDLEDDNFVSYSYEGDGDSWGHWHTYLNPIEIE